MKTLIYTVTYGNRINPCQDDGNPETRIATSREEIINMILFGTLPAEFLEVMIHCEPALGMDWMENIKKDPVGYYDDADLNYFINIKAHEVIFDRIEFHAVYVK